MAGEEEFKTFYDTHLADLVQSTASAFKQLKNQKAIQVATYFGVFGLIFLFVAVLKRPDLVGFAFVGGAIVSIVSATYRKKARTLQNNEFAKILAAWLPYFGDFKYAPETVINEKTIEISQLFPQTEGYNISEKIEGHMGDTHIKFCTLEDVSKEKSNNIGRLMDKKYSLFLFANFNKDFNGGTLVYSKSGSIPVVDSMLNKWNMPGYQKVVLENPAFNKEFEVFSTDQVEARYILTPAFMGDLI